MRKIAIVKFHNGFSLRDVSGVTTAPIYLASQLKKYFDVDLITLSDDKRYTSSIASEVIHCEDPKVLEDYDFVIFGTPGLICEKYNEATPNKYVDIISHAKKFTFLCHDENDRKLYPYHMNFLHHPNMTFVTFNCPGMAEAFKDYTDICRSWEYVSFTPEMPSKEMILEKARNKSNKIMSTCRWTTAKRIYEYISMTDEFVANGIEVFTAGAHQSHWYNLQMEELSTKNYTDLDYFEPGQLPEILEDVKYHWNFLFLKRSMGLRNHNPRVEIATLEAFYEGCLPILCTESTPEWIGHDSAVRLSKDSYTELPEILGNMSDEERYERLSNFYDLVQNNIVAHYQNVADRIEEVCN